MTCSPVGKASAEAALRAAIERSSSVTNEEPDNVSFRPIDLVTAQHDDLLRENQRLFMELRLLREPRP